MSEVPLSPIPPRRQDQPHQPSQDQQQQSQQSHPVAAPQYPPQHYDAQPVTFSNVEPGNVAAPSAAVYAAPYPPVAPVAAPAYPYPMPVLPPGSMSYNGGILVSEGASGMFANAYSVPGPHGRGRVYFDRSVPMPPQPPTRPTLREQWDTLTTWLKVFIVFLIAIFIILLAAQWQVGVVMPLVLLPTYLLYRQWAKHYQEVELYMLLRVYATAFVPGALVVMLIEGVITVLFIVIILPDALRQLVKGLGEDPSKSPTSPDGRKNPPGLEFLSLPESAPLFIFLFLLAYVSAGGVEESLKYYLTRKVNKLRPAYKNIRGITLYAVAAALGFSTVENIGYVSSGAAMDPSFLAVFVNALGRVLISTPLHLMCGYLMALRLCRREVLGELSLGRFRLLFPSVFWHGSFDFFLFVIMVLSQRWSDKPGEDMKSLAWMSLVVVACFVGLYMNIRQEKKKIQQALDEGAGGGAAPMVGVDVDPMAHGHEPDGGDVDGRENGVAQGQQAGGSGHAVAASVRPDGFSRLSDEELV